jgi:hypothetical protein
VRCLWKAKKSSVSANIPNWLNAVQDALIAAWLFLVLMWALIARSISVALLQYNSITWCGDCLVIKLGSVRCVKYILILLSLFLFILIHVYFTQHKANSEGKEDYPKHVYANMEKP